MGSHGPGRKRIPNREKMTAEDDALNQIAREAAVRLAARRAARAEAQEIRMKELERQQKEPSDYSWCLGSSSRTSSRTSSARASPVVEERPDRDFLEKGSRMLSTLSAATLASLGGASSRRGSGDTSLSVETEASIRDMNVISCETLMEVEEKYRKTMVANAHLYNDKSTLLYQVETLKEELSNMEELLWESQRHADDIAKEFQQERHAHSLLQFQVKDMKESLRQTEELLTEVSELRLKSRTCCQEICDLQEVLQWKDKKIAALERHREISDVVRIDRDRLSVEVVRLSDILKEHGIMVSPDVSANGNMGQGKNEDDVTTDPTLLLAKVSNGGQVSMLEVHLKKLFEERERLHDEVRLLKSQLNQKHTTGTDGVQDPDVGGLENGTSANLLDLQRDTNRQMNDLKFKLMKSEQQVATLEQNIIRLEGQVSRHKLAAENAEKMEDDLKVEKRKLQRELRSALDRIDELEATNNLLSKRLEKMKANRSALLAQQ